MLKAQVWSRIMGLLYFTSCCNNVVCVHKRQVYHETCRKAQSLLSYFAVQVIALKLLTQYTTMKTVAC